MATWEEVLSTYLREVGGVHCVLSNTPCQENCILYNTRERKQNIDFL